MYKSLLFPAFLFAATAVAQKDDTPTATADFDLSSLMTGLSSDSMKDIMKQMLPGSCVDAFSGLLEPKCMNLVMSNMVDGFPMVTGMPTNVSPAMTSSLASCMCSTSGVYAGPYVDGKMSSCVDELKTMGGTQISFAPEVTEVLGICKKYGGGGSDDASATGAAAVSNGKESATGTSTSSAPAASGSSAANSNVKVDWIVMGSAAFVAGVSALAATL